MKRSDKVMEVLRVLQYIQTPSGQLSWERFAVVCHGGVMDATGTYKTVLYSVTSVWLPAVS